MTEELEQQRTAVPALRETPATQITSEDVSLPKVYIGQSLSAAVQNGDVEVGQIYTALGPEDPDPQIVYDPSAKKGTKLASGLLFHPIALIKGKSLQIDDELKTYRFDDETAPREAWTTYSYLLALPEVDEDVPYKWLLTKSNKPAALQINTVLKKNASKGPQWVNAFRATTSERSKTMGNREVKYHIARIQPADPDPKHTELAEKFAVELSGQAADVRSSGDEPEL